MKHFYQSIDGWFAFQPIYDRALRFHADDGAKFVEVGSWLGRSAAYMAVELENKGRSVEFVCVDPWQDGGPDLRDTRYFKELAVPQVYDIFCRNIAPVQHRIKAMRMSSIEAAAYFGEKSVDFLMLDGDHSYEAVKADLDAWMPKMKDGGLISGDDYTWPGVEQAVRDYFGPTKRIVEYRVNGRRNRDPKMDSSFWWVVL